MLPVEVWAKLNSLSKRAKSAEISSESFTIGRLATNDLQIPDMKVSGFHCKIMRKFDNSGKMISILEDNSSNGTYYNGEKVSSFHKLCSRS